MPFKKKSLDMINQFNRGRRLKQKKNSQHVTFLIKKTSEKKKDSHKNMNAYKTT